MVLIRSKGMVTMHAHYNGQSIILELNDGFNDSSFELNSGEVDELIGILQDISKTISSEGE